MKTKPMMRRNHLTISITLIMVGESQQYARLNRFLFDEFKQQKPATKWKQITWDNWE